MVSRKEAIMFFETKATREKWLDRFAVSNLPIDVFCEMNHIKKEMLVKTLNEKMNNHRKEHPPKEPAVKITDFMEIEPIQEKIIEKVKLFDDEPEYEQNPREITIRLGKAIIVLPVGIRQEQLVTILMAVTEV